MSSEIKSKIKILLVGGGTGGHFYPLISIAETLNLESVRPSLYYAGPTKYDANLLEENNIKFVHIPAGKRRHYFSLLNFFDFFKTLYGIGLSLIKLLVIYPDVVFSKGGYTSVPVIFAAAFLRIPIIVHESDSVFGSANRFGSRFAKHIITSYENVLLDKKRNAKIINLGIPIRKILLGAPSKDSVSSLGIDPDRPVVLILGGSQGAERINQQIFASLDDLLKKYTIIHQTGAENYDMSIQTAEKLIPDVELRKHYHAAPFLDAKRLNDVYHIASVVVSRAGSTAMYEIALHKKPAIIIPIPESISHDQRTNAYANARLGGAVVIEEENLKENILISEIDRIVQNTDIYESMVAATDLFAKRDASERISELINNLAQEHIS